MFFSKSIAVINNKSRNPVIDVFRAIAILAVVTFHFNNEIAPFGFLGVDLFFVISGTLIGGILIKQFKSGQQINFFKFFFERGFKIWPSYYFFLAAGTLVSFCFYRGSAPDQIIPLWDIKRYLFFYQNYTGAPFHWSFDHVWSLCVEEHFYIMLPILFIIIQRGQSEKQLLLGAIILTIFSGIAFKFASFYLTHSKDTYSGTHNRIDALAWGVLLSYIIGYHEEKLRVFKYKKIIFLAGATALGLSIYYATLNTPFYYKVIFHSVVPPCLFLMIMGSYFIDLSKLKVLRFIAYYSYNWYLWHPLFVLFFVQLFEKGFAGLTLYLITTFTIAIITTTLIEEPLLNYRKAVINRIFKEKKGDYLRVRPK
ncbi:MAG: acyltransferase [Bacteroidota bacterium]